MTLREPQAHPGQGGVGGRFDLTDRLAVVTGAGGKLGPVWIEALLEAGARVAALDLPGVPPSARFASLQRSAGDRLHSVDCDITVRASIEGAERVVRTAPCPVLTVRTTTPRASEVQTRTTVTVV